MKHSNDSLATSNPALSRWVACETCRSQGKRYRRPARKSRKLSQGQANIGDPAIPASRHLQVCKQCQGSGLVVALSNSTSGGIVADTVSDTDRCYPRVAIVGGGLAGLALATALKHRNIPCRIYERDKHFLDRSQGYGLTLQQASKALVGFGIDALRDGIVSTKHIVHRTDGTVVGEWGFRRWGRSSDKEPKRQNVHIARQALRYQLLEAAGGAEAVQWNYKLVSFEENADSVLLKFEAGDSIVEESADLLVGADGIRSMVRHQWIGNDVTPLRYLDCMVLLGICPLDAVRPLESELLDGETVFQTADGETRIYMMPYSETEYMWQLSFPMEESVAAQLSRLGPRALKQEGINRCHSWHSPVPQILEATPEAQVSGYPVYDRNLLSPEQMDSSSRVTLIGDACHPMSPFKGQGANQALLDALQLARSIYLVKDAISLESALRTFERDMLERSAVKVKASAQAAQFLHSQVAIQEGNLTRGAAAAAASSCHSYQET